ncbi:MAG TPA: hypothetical protein VGS80_16955 [Ktedonobacterales bacterium]|jgi:hypothetical protein|nr:hypothetical protein [Ktedonobacterales bacterium]
MTELRTAGSRSLLPNTMLRVANVFVSLLLRSPPHRPMSAYLLLLPDLHRAHEWQQIPSPWRVSARGQQRHPRRRQFLVEKPAGVERAPVDLRIAGEDLSGIATRRQSRTRRWRLRS